MQENHFDRLQTPPMGWNSWDCYGAAVDEKTVRENAKYMAAHLKKYGWEYVVVDIQWYEPTASSNDYHPFADLCIDKYSRVIPAENRFPSSKDGKGFGPLADYVHSLGLKFGIHIMRGIPRQAVHQNLKIKGTNVTARDIARGESVCTWNNDMYGVNPSKEGAREYYESIFELYASWGVDFVKLDDICRELPDAEAELLLISDCIKRCGRDMLLSLSPGPALIEKTELYKQVANMWRITDDFWDDWKLLYNMFERAEKWSVHAGDGHWPDADMLPIGAIRQCYDPRNTTNFTADEQMTMMSLWCIMRSPLMMGGELTKTDSFTLSLLTNENLLEMHRNSRRGHQVFRREINGHEIIGWSSTSINGESYIAIFNASDEGAEVQIPLNEFETENVASMVDIWTSEKTAFEDEICVQIPMHGVKLYKLL